MNAKKWLASWYKPRSLFDPTKNYSQISQKLVKKYLHMKILNVGAGESPLGKAVITLDKYSQASIKGDALALPIKTNSVDLILSIAVLEHLKEPYQAIQEMQRVLKKSGEIYIEIPFLQPFHGTPDDYFRASLSGLQHWCRHFKEIKSGVCVGPGSAVAWIEIEYLRLWLGKIPLFGLLVELILRLWTLPLKCLDKYLISKKEAFKTASAVYFYGRKV